MISFKKISIYFLVNDELFPEETSFISMEAPKQIGRRRNGSAKLSGMIYVFSLDVDSLIDSSILIQSII